MKSTHVILVLIKFNWTGGETSLGKVDTYLAKIAVSTIFF